MDISAQERTFDVIQSAVSEYVPRNFVSFNGTELSEFGCSRLKEVNTLLKGEEEVDAKIMKYFALSKITKLLLYIERLLDK